MKPFDLEAAKRGEPIVTRDGRKAKFVAYAETANEKSRVIFQIDDLVFHCSETGSFLGYADCDRDLFMGQPWPKIITDASNRIGSWLSAALDDPHACEEFKKDVRLWFDAGRPGFCAERPGMHSINGHEYPEPVRGPMEDGQEYWFVDITTKDLVVKNRWDDTNIEFLCLKRGLIHLTREAAEAHARAIILAGGGEV